MAPRRKVPPIEVQISTTIAVTEDLIVDAFPSLDIPPEIPSPKRSKRTRSPRKKEEAWDYPDADPDDSPLTDLDDDFDASPSKKKKLGKAGTIKRKRKNQEPIVYDIPPVEPKETSFKGRLGYACLNTVLRALKPDPVFCSRTCRLDTIRKNGIDFAKNLGKQNAKDMIKIIEWNEENNIRFLRMSSEMFPFASHGEHGYDLAYAKKELKAVGDLAKKLGHRLTTHPGQFTQLASPKENVVEASVRELDYHCQMMRYMGLGSDSVIIIHMGGVYGDKPTTLERFKENYRTKLTDEMKARLVLENDEMCYSVDDLLPVCKELDIPIVFDYHHNWINPSVIPIAELIPLINETWHKKGIKPKQHLSSPKPQFEDGSGNVMDRRAHADRCKELPAELSIPGIGGSWIAGKEGVDGAGDVDLMIEAKDKEQAVFQLYRTYGLKPVKYENLRPEKPQAAAAGAVEDEDDVPVAVDGDGEDGPSESPRKRRKLARTKSGEIASEPDTPNASPKKAKKAKTPKKGVTAALPDVVDGTTSQSKKSPKTSRGKKGKAVVNDMANEDMKSLVNQEDAPIPVDGTDVGVVEAEEHPEAVAAAALDGDGCGVGTDGSTGRKNTTASRKRGRKS